MSIDRATVSFLETLHEDTAMQGDLDTALAGAGDHRAAIVQFAHARGYEITAEGLDAAKEALAAPVELNETELDSVAGGFNPQPEPPARTSSGAVIRVSRTFSSRYLRW